MLQRTCPQQSIPAPKRTAPPPLTPFSAEQSACRRNKLLDKGAEQVYFAKKQYSFKFVRYPLPAMECLMDTIQWRPEVNVLLGLSSIASAVLSTCFYPFLLRDLLVVCLVLSACWCQAYEDLPIPEGYILQYLDPTDGRIAKPKDWYYTSRGTQSGWLWTLSSENPAKGFYETGLRIQLLLGVKHVTKRSTKEFAQDFLEQKRKTTKVICEHEPVDQGDFTRQCLEVMETLNLPEGPVVFHILYSVFWGKEMDMVLLSTFGTPEEKWQDYMSVSKIMATFDLIGPNFGK
ncbi:hypothetical protein VU06_02775 [Desulfobulbus sp. F3]|nr:hypothetical protein [Desulfobulbus sp. F3]